MMKKRGTRTKRKRERRDADVKKAQICVGLFWAAAAWMLLVFLAVPACHLPGFVLSLLLIPACGAAWYISVTWMDLPEEARPKSFSFMDHRRVLFRFPMFLTVVIIVFLFL